MKIQPLFAAAADAGSTNSPATLTERFKDFTGMPLWVGHWILNISGAILIIVIGALLAGTARKVLRRVCAQRKIDATVGSFASNLLHALIMTFAVISALERLGVDTKSFAAIIAAAGLAVGLALQGGLSNFAAGVLIIIFRPFKTGDSIQGGGIEGVVEEVQIFSTTLNTPDNKKIIIPNSSITNGSITNFTANPTRRVDIQVTVGAGQDLARTHELLLATANADPRVLKSPAASSANVKLVDGGTLVELRAWTKTGDHGNVTHDLVAKIPPALAAAGVKGPDKTVYYVERK